MKKIIQVLSAFCAAGLFCMASYAAEPGVAMAGSTEKIEMEGVKAGAISTEIIQVTAKIIQINYEERTVVLATADDAMLELEVTESAKNFKNIQLGDMVNAEYLESVALFATEPGSGEKANIAGAVMLAAEGELPGGIVADTVEITAVVEAIDYETRTVTLKGPLRTVTMQVDERATRFENIKQGDEVHFMHTEAVAINVTRVESGE